MNDQTEKSSLTTRFAELFQGRTDAYGTENGGCVRVERPDKFPSTLQRYQMHLDGDVPMGVYPMVPMTATRVVPGTPIPYEHAETTTVSTWIVKWGCVDLDVKSPTKRRYDFETSDDAAIAAWNLQKALASFGVGSWVELTRSRGWHVWVFAAEWVPAATMRRALMVACQVADVPTTEVNPKQESLAEGQLGNYVRIMYPAGGMDEWADRTGVVGGVVGGGRELLRSEEAQYQNGINEILSSDFIADDRSGRGGARCAYCGVRRVGLRGQQVKEGSGAAGVSREGHLPLASSGFGRRSDPNGGSPSLHGQSSVRADQGNPVRVAYDAESSQPICLSCFVERAISSRVGSETLSEMAALYVPPSVRRPERTIASFDPPEISQEITTRMSPLTWHIYNNGPSEKGDRSGTLVRLAHLCCADGFSEDETLAIVSEADAAWGQKFTHRKDADKRYREIVERAYVGGV